MGGIQAPMQPMNLLYERLDLALVVRVFLPVVSAWNCQCLACLQGSIGPVHRHECRTHSFLDGLHKHHEHDHGSVRDMHSMAPLN